MGQQAQKNPMIEIFFFSIRGGGVADADGIPEIFIEEVFDEGRISSGKRITETIQLRGILFLQCPETIPGSGG